MRLTSLVVVFLVVVSIGSLWAFASPVEKVDLTPAQLLKTATHVVVGQVRQIWTREESTHEWKTTFHCAEVAVATVEKGDGVAPGSVVYVRYWHREWIGSRPMPPSSNGHRGLPKAGDTIRAYLARNAYDGFGSTSDGGFNVIGANGFAGVQSADTKSALPYPLR